MTTLTLETEPIASQIMVTDEKLIIDLMDGRSLIVPLGWYPRLMHASTEERQNCSNSQYENNSHENAQF
ncbi:DUF2442 domain-containing protein [Phormidesmis priestleyi ULC007]|uniref:DUF2442 domain-containing protein n=1 Tax=Phormidesmis priestleyi ULC007 TaxID=1920490 RepID=A0A2T1D818_9CYAN|nr:DUF2442 domain-containing protein [Phormidesmis priestleyi]PSB16642.1 DUF2442 domain-containing protein [Phormidesmis priestleyi ULC007]PZO47544.1 MAG: DUF2442 domain-containing protein [Phormidesmis priestleyi]